jgi:hypothetical protein
MNEPTMDELIRTAAGRPKQRPRLPDSFKSAALSGPVVREAGSTRNASGIGAEQAQRQREADRASGSGWDWPR